MSDIVKEYNTYRVRASFKDDDASAVVPTSGVYRVDDITGGVITSVVASTEFTPINNILRYRHSVWGEHCS